MTRQGAIDAVKASQDNGGGRRLKGLASDGDGPGAYVVARDGNDVPYTVGDTLDYALVLTAHHAGVNTTAREFADQWANHLRYMRDQLDAAINALDNLSTN